ncbi:hypothetical protein JK358_06260 [Nocardia sp. 2]|uniref:Uncharacterized protein n=1 Tax=Nocardia acididurans TaxID=2802282 RepID=A0ABS1M005_9NOCA|nr:hypothetical protein [Nocardia acididurans]MBL1073993.1 hypothetical protein [Nocardia acididurans]
MSDPYGPSFPPPQFMAPKDQESAPATNLLSRLPAVPAVSIPVLAILATIGMLAVVMFQAEHPSAQSVDSTPTPATSAAATPHPTVPHPAS